MMTIVFVGIALLLLWITTNYENKCNLCDKTACPKVYFAHRTVDIRSFRNITGYHILLYHTR